MKKLLIGCLVLIVGVPLLLVLVAVFALNDTYSVERETTIAATPVAVHATVGDLTTWPEWSAWNTQKDPEVKFTFSEPASGVGAVWEWNSPGPLKSGSLTLTRSSVAEGVHYDLVFEDGGREYRSTGSLVFAADGAGTKVTWTNGGQLDGVVEKLFGLLMDAMMGPDFEAGLRGLKSRLEGSASDEAAPDAAPGDGEGDGAGDGER
jgi:hypothetical protein